MQFFVFFFTSCFSLVSLQRRPWQTSSDNPMRGVVIWPEKEVMETTVTLYKVWHCRNVCVCVHTVGSMLCVYCYNAWLFNVQGLLCD